MSELKLKDEVTGDVYPCPQGHTLRIGRAHTDPPPQIPVDDSRVSRQHCVIVPEAGGLRITDTSSYGTYVNGEKIVSGIARAGDRVQLGAHYAFTVILVESAEIPERVGGHYCVVRELARGGMGVVLEGYDEKTQRACAIKVLRGTRLKPEAVARFQREAVVGQRLAGHRGIVPVWDAGALPSGDPFYVMELIEGDSLSVRIMEGLEQRRAVELVLEVVKAVAFAHAAGVIHRDLKPQNVIVTSGGHARLTDFGVAKALDEQDELTATGAVMGTITYMSPEQVQDSKRVDERTDVYGLGGVLYAALTRRPPLDLDGLSMRAALDRVLEHAVVSPRNVLGSHAIDPNLDAIVMRAIEQDPDERFQSADEMAQALEAWLEGDRSVAAPLAAPEGAGEDDAAGAAVLCLFMVLGVLLFVGLAAFAILR